MSKLRELGASSKSIKPAEPEKQPIQQKEKIRISVFLGEILLKNGKKIFVGVTPNGNLAAADLISDFNLDTTESHATAGDMGLGKRIDLTEYDSVIPLYVDRTQAEIVRVMELNRTGSYIKIVATIPAGSLVNTSLSTLDGTTRELTYSLQQFLEHFKNSQPFFSLRSSRQTSVSTFLVLDVPEGALNLPVDQRNGLAICFQWENSALQTIVGDPGVSSVHILAKFVEELITRIDYESHDTYSELIEAVKLLFTITSKEIGFARRLQMRFSWDVSDDELQVLTKIAAKIHDPRLPHPFLLPQLIITAIAHYNGLRGETHAELIKNLVDWLATDPTGLLKEPEPQISHKSLKKSSPAPEPTYSYVKTAYSSDEKHFPVCSDIDKKWLRIQVIRDRIGRASELHELHNAQDISNWCEELCSLLSNQANADIHVRFHILKKLHQYIRNGTLLDGHVQLIGKDDKNLEMTLKDHLYSRATQILHSMALLDDHALQRSSFLDGSFRESGALHFMCQMYKFESEELSTRFMEKWITAHVNRIKNFTPPFNSQVIEASKELVDQTEFFLENADPATTKASILHCRMLIHWVKSIFNTANASFYPKFITPTATGGIEPIDEALFTVTQWKLSPELEIPVHTPEQNPDNYKKWVDSVVSAYTSGVETVASVHLLQKLQDFYKYAFENKLLQKMRVTGENLTLPNYVRSKIDELRCSHLASIDKESIETRCYKLVQAVQMEPDQFSLIPDKTLRLFVIQISTLFQHYSNGKPQSTTDAEKVSLLQLFSSVEKVAKYCKGATSSVQRPGDAMTPTLDKLNSFMDKSSVIKWAINPSNQPIPHNRSRRW